MLDKVNLADALAGVTDPWMPRAVAAYNDDTVQVLRVRGEFVWHAHDGTDDLFLVLRGSIVVQLREGDVTLAQGELCVVPAGTEHCVRADEEAEVLVIERLGEAGDAAGVRVLEAEAELRWSR